MSPAQERAMQSPDFHLSQSAYTILTESKHIARCILDAQTASVLDEAGADIDAAIACLQDRKREIAARKSALAAAPADSQCDPRACPEFYAHLHCCRCRKVLLAIPDDPVHAFDGPQIAGYEDAQACIVCNEFDSLLCTDCAAVDPVCPFCKAASPKCCEECRIGAVA